MLETQVRAVQLATVVPEDLVVLAELEELETQDLAAAVAAVAAAAKALAEGVDHLAAVELDLVEDMLDTRQVVVVTPVVMVNPEVLVVPTQETQETRVLLAQVEMLDNPDHLEVLVLQDNQPLQWDLHLLVVQLETQAVAMLETQEILDKLAMLETQEILVLLAVLVQLETLEEVEKEHPLKEGVKEKVVGEVITAAAVATPEDNMVVLMVQGLLTEAAVTAQEALAATAGIFVPVLAAVAELVVQEEVEAQEIQEAQDLQEDLEIRDRQEMLLLEIQDHLHQQALHLQ